MYHLYQIINDTEAISIMRYIPKNLLQFYINWASNNKPKLENSYYIMYEGEL